LMKIAVLLMALPVLAGQAFAISICDVQTYDPSTGFSPYDGSTVTVTGVVTVPAGIFVPTQASMYIRGLGDDVCGINIFLAGQVGNVGLGDTVTVTGVVEDYVSTSGNGATTEMVFTETGLTNIRKTAVPHVEPVEMRTGDVGREENEGKLVRVTGKVVGVAPPEEVILDDGSGRISIYDLYGVFAGDPIWESLTWGDVVTISGVVTQYDPSIPYLSGYQVWPRSPNPPFDDISIPQCIPDTTTVKASLEILDTAGDKVGVFCPGCPGSDGLVRIRYNGPNQSRLRLRVFDCYGREVATLHDYYVYCGAIVYEWDGRNEISERLPMGLYHIVITATDPVSGDRSQASAPIVIGRRLK
jgi:hypothetical protein